MIKILLGFLAAVLCLSLPSCVTFVPDQGGGPPIQYARAPVIPYGHAERFGFGGPGQMHPQMHRGYDGGPQHYNQTSEQMYGSGSAGAANVVPPGRNSIGFQEWRANGNGSSYGTW